jgi:hypothetical protein
MTKPNELLYAIPTIVLIPIMLIMLFAVIALGGRYGQSLSSLVSEAEKLQVSAMQGSLMGLLALLVGFSFSLALSRFNDRSVAVVTEANAIGTAWLRSDLLEGPAKAALQSALADYAAARLAEGQYDITRSEIRKIELEKEAAAFKTAWTIATTAARANPNPVTVALVTALNDMTDSFSSHEASLNRHVPEIVLILQFVTLLFLGWIVGYSSGESGYGPTTPMLVMMALNVLLLALVLDLDRPRRGIIQVDQTPMVIVTTQILFEAGRMPGLTD